MKAIIKNDTLSCMSAKETVTFRFSQRWVWGIRGYTTEERGSYTILRNTESVLPENTVYIGFSDGYMEGGG